MDLTLDQALQRGVEAHKAGKAEEADQYYTAILKAQPKHPDANHNMGVLAVGFGKVQEALPFFKTALEGNASIAQYWLSYINALTKLDRIDEAKAVFEEAKSKGAKGDGFDQIERWLGSSDFEKSNDQELPQEQLDSLISLYNQNRLQQVFDEAQLLTQRYTKSLFLWNILGASGAQIGELEQAIFAFTKALIIKPDYDEAYNNLGAALQEQGKLDDAIKSFNNAISINPNYAEAYYNMGNVLQEKGQLEEAVEAFEKAISIKPSYFEAHNNVGLALQQKGKLQEAIASYTKALSLNTNCADMIPSASALINQISNTALTTKELEKKVGTQSLESTDRPMFHIHQALRAFLLADLKLVCTHLNGYTSCTPSSIAKLPPKDQVFCSAYKHFLQKLVEIPFENEPTFTDDQNVFHLGESHCLSYAHRHISIQGIDYTTVPRITFGGKAYHFSRTKEDGIKAITKANFDSLPDGSKVFLSFGEIDCRPNEGFISAASKLNRPIESIISDTVDGYVDWFAEQNQIKNHSLFFFNVPAPVYDKKYTAEVNEEVKTTIELFNNLLSKSILNNDFKIIDVYKFTVGHDGFSNGFFHIDNRHLSRDAIPEIEKQICS